MNPILSKTVNQREIEDAIIDLYLNVKIRKQEDIDMYNNNLKQKEINLLKKHSPLTIIEYIKSSIEILVNLRVQEKLLDKDVKSSNESLRQNTTTNSSSVNYYEELLKEQEHELRKKAQREMQLKFKIESMELKIKELEYSLSQLESNIHELQQPNLAYLHTSSSFTNRNKDIKTVSDTPRIVSKDYKENFIQIEDNENSNLEQDFNAMSFGCGFKNEENIKNSKLNSKFNESLMTEIEKKIQKQQKEFSNKFNILEENYKKQIDHLNDKIEKYEHIQTLSSNQQSLKGNIDLFDEIRHNNTRNYISALNHNNTHSSRENSYDINDKITSKVLYNNTSSNIKTKIFNKVDLLTTKKKEGSSLNSTLKTVQKVSNNIGITNQLNKTINHINPKVTKMNQKPELKGRSLSPRPDLNYNQSQINKHASMINYEYASNNNCSIKNNDNIVFDEKNFTFRSSSKLTNDKKSTDKKNIILNQNGFKFNNINIFPPSFTTSDLIDTMTKEQEPNKQRKGNVLKINKPLGKTKPQNTIIQNRLKSGNNSGASSVRYSNNTSIEKDYNNITDKFKKQSHTSRINPYNN